MQNHIVIMAGGIGSRFWPMSTPEYPKQFIDVMGVGKSLIQLTVERFKGICPKENFWVVTSERYVDIVKEQLPQIPAQHILAEPEARNTAPCIAYACWKIRKEFPQANIVVTPSDALVIDTAEFARCIAVALEKTADSQAIVTLGMKPTRPETGYGYIAAQGEADTKGICKVEAFKEKPDVETAKGYLAAGNYFWNAGIFVWNADTITNAIRRYAPQIAGVMDELEPALFTDKEAAEFGWSDLGSWGSLRTLLPQNEAGNAKVGGRVDMYNCRNCVVYAAEEKRMVLEGLDGYIVAEKDGRLLVCRLSEEQRIKDFAAGK